MNYGVVVGRFQNAEITSAHRMVFDHAYYESDEVIVFVGESPVPNTTVNPIPAKLIAEMIKKEFATFNVIVLPDHQSDERWIENLENAIDKIAGNNEVTLYGGRDSFLKVYKGKFKTQEIPEKPDISSTQERLEVFQGDFKNNKDFRKGLIYASQMRFPTVYSTVDMAAIRNHSKEVLLGRKPGMKTWCFPGGFVDPKDQSLFAAAKREFKEEVVNLDVTDIQYLDSIRIDDWRYKRTNDGIMTHFFILEVSKEEPIAGDDLEEARWFTLEDAEKVLGRNHKNLLLRLKNEICEKIL